MLKPGRWKINSSVSVESSRLFKEDFALAYFTDLFHVLDMDLVSFLTYHNSLAYATFFLIIFFETGVLFAALLPGDSLLLACAALAAHSPELINIYILFFILVTAVIAGNLLNYFTGRWLGSKMFSSRLAQRFIDRKNVEKAFDMYNQWGGRVIIIASFLPIVRTFVPFITGIAIMPFRRFLLYSCLGAILWVGVLLYGSYIVNSVPFVREHIKLIIVVAIIAVASLTILKRIRQLKSG